MEHYAGIDVSLERSSVCVVDATGKIVREAKVASEPEALVRFFRELGLPLTRGGLEAGPLSQWLHAGLTGAGLEAVLLETRHVKAAAVSTRSATGAGVRLGRPGRGRQVLVEDFARRAVAEATPRGAVEPVGEPPQGRRRERPGLGLARQGTPDAAVRVLGGAFLPGGVRVAEVAGHAQLPVEGGVAGELGPAVEGDGPAGVLGQPPERLGDTRGHRRRALVLVGQQEDEAARPLHQRGHVRLADLPAEDQQVGLPVPEALPVLDLHRTILDPALAPYRGAARPSAVAAAAPPARLRQVAVQAVLPALGPVDVAVDRLVADRGSALFLFQPSGD